MAQQHDDKSWLDNVYDKLHKSVNDLPFLKIINDIRKDNDNTKPSTINSYQYLADSQFIDDYDTVHDIDALKPDAEPPPSHKHDFDGHTWNINDDGKWKPPPPSTPNIHALNDQSTSSPDKPSPTINRTNAGNNNFQNDSGANRIVTDKLDNLQNVQIIDPIPMGGCNKNDSAAIVCTMVGELPISDTSGNILMVKAYYSAEVDGTIISPTALVRQHIDKFTAWLKYCNCDDNKGVLKLIGRNGQDNLSFAIHCSNDLWYHAPDSIGNSTAPTINRISNAASFELWHQRTAHAGINILDKLHKHSIGVPPLKGNSFYRCPSCMSGKLCTKRAIGKPTPSKGAQLPPPTSINKDKSAPDDTDDIHIPNSEPGQHFLMDFGFVRSSDYSIKTEDGKTITSIDGKNSYLSIIDRSSRYMWIFPTSSKTPPIEAVKSILTKFKSKNPHRTVRVDQGGELGRSAQFATMISECEFALEITGSDASAQNGLVENPNKIFGQMMRCMLHSSELGPEYWSYALQHAVYIRNRLPHFTIKTSPYEAFTSLQPDLSGLRIFGSRVYARKPGRRKAKLDHNVYKGYFLGYTATDKNIIYIDEDSGKIKTATHVIFDEAHMSVPASKAPLAAQTLQRLGYYSKEDWIKEEFDTVKSNEFLVQQLTSSSTIPTRSTPQSIGYDLHIDSPTDITIPAGLTMPLPTGLAIQCPTGTYARIAPRSGLTLNKSLTTLAGVVDPDYRGNVTVLMHNFGKEHQIIKSGQRIAQIILENASTPPIHVVPNLDTTQRASQSFGSTERRTAIDLTKPLQKVDKIPPSIILPTIPNVYENNAAAAATLFSDIQTTFERPNDIILSHDPYDNHTHRILNIKISDTDPMFGLNIINCPLRGLPKLVDCKPGTSAIRIPKWRSELRDAYITHVDNVPTNSLSDISRQFQLIRNEQRADVKIGFSTINKQSMHPQLGVPQLYHDQMNIIGKHLWDIAHDPSWQATIEEETIFPATRASIARITKLTRQRLGKDKFWSLLSQLPSWYKIAALKKARTKKLTRRFLIEQDDWSDWEASERKQLNQYEAQETFGRPCKLPKGANLLPLLWTYLIKDCGTKKARCVCNGSSKMKGTVTLGDTYAGSLEQTGSRIFWASTALYNFVTIGADASNAFAEAPAPKAPLYVTIDKPFHDWYNHKYPNKPPIPKDFVLPVHGALQGHPESARLWAKLIDKIIQNLNLKPCTHEPCLYYSNNFDNTGKTVLFLRQVDDFAIACQDKTLASSIIKMINDKMTIDVKELGQISRFNGVDVLQSKHFVKIYNKTYIKKMLAKHDWIHHETELPAATFPIPMKSEAAYQRKLETADTPSESEIAALEKKYGFGYRQAIGELIYALVTCRPDISFPVIKLSQYSTRPTDIHFEAVKQIYRYLNATQDEGIYYWRKQPRHDLPTCDLPSCKHDTNYNESEIHERQQPGHSVMFGAVDSDYAGDVSHRRSVTGIILRIAGGTIFYKSKFQDTVALSSTEAEFTAAAEAGKYILYVRSILEQLGIPQNEATTLYEDNQGALLMANAQQPTKRTRHMDIKTFVLQHWVEQDLIRLKRINTTDNYSDVMTKATGRTLFYRHMNYILGKVIPAYCRTNLSINNLYSQQSNLDQTVESTGGYYMDISGNPEDTRIIHIDTG